MEKQFKVDRETAVSEFEKYCEANEIDYDESAMSDEDIEGFKPLKERFVKACMAGRVEVDGTEIKYTVSQFSSKNGGDVVTIKRPAGKSFIAMDGSSDKQSVKKLQAFFSAMTGKETSYFSNLDVKDWLFFQGVAILFLAE
ncbi:hypothetical protein E4O00_03380 [Treponema sp. OMZ 788]|uniref:hypothetical protein n=1 Tax=Treponema sp. OMZ 788 TaxID=2563664 RepID=UPI0020A3FC99|nr:hypothetical protein [Treponema sp. OMZ 788]UTC65216.1 hypothetical protein E4O00_03380 [Treponema sp. OMZ 788]